jgi:hypothetical protein
VEIPKFQFFSRTKDFGVFSRSFITPCECKHCAKQTIHCPIYKQTHHCPRLSIPIGILELWNHVVLQQIYIILYISISITTTTTTNTITITNLVFCDSNPVPKFQHHFTNNQITPARAISKSCIKTCIKQVTVVKSELSREVA